MNAPRRRLIYPAGLIAALIALAAPAVAVARAPLVLPGWPVPSIAGSVVDGPDGGAVVIAEGFPELDNVPRSILIALRRNGSIAWRNSREWGCGNCDDGFQTPGLQSDGSYGPIGPEGDGVWGVDASGHTVGTCLGVMLRDLTCISHESTFTAEVTQGGLVARRGGAVLWRAERPDHTWVYQSTHGAPPPIAADRGGLAYTTIGAGKESGIDVPSRMVAVDVATGVERWRIENATPLAALASGVLAHHSGLGLVRYDANGTQGWRRTIGGLPFLASRVDVDRGRLYLWQHDRFSKARAITALDATTGALLWRTSSGDLARLLHVRRNGTVLAAVDRPDRTGVRAIGLDGRTRWQFDTLTSVAGAHALGDGTIVVTTEAGYPGFATAAGLAWRIDPNRTAPSRTSIVLGPRDFVTTRSCIANCALRRDYGTVLRLRMPARTSLRVRLIADGREVPNTRFTLVAPAGQSAARIYTTAELGAATLEVRSQVAGRRLVRQFAVRIR